jgi:hypothetical protein
MQNSNRELPKYLAENKPSKCFVFRHPNHFQRKSVLFSYARGEDRETVRQQAIDYTNEKNQALGPVILHGSCEGRMTSRNKSGIVRVNPKRTRAPRNGLFYYSWNAKWKNCPQHGGISWPCMMHTDDGAYILACLSLEMRTINRDRVLEEFKNIEGKQKWKEILSHRPKFRIEDFWPDLA